MAPPTAAMANTTQPTKNHVGGCGVRGVPTWSSSVTVLFRTAAGRAYISKPQCNRRQHHHAAPQPRQSPVAVSPTLTRRALRATGEQGHRAHV